MRVLLGLSGGVDSTASIVLLQKAGHEVVGCTLRLWGAGQDTERARLAAERFGIEFFEEDATALFESCVKKPFVQSYCGGLTPNPCVLCNRGIKFGLMAELAERHGCEKLATGHYAAIGTIRDGTPCLRKGADRKKDQSYFLWSINKDVIPRLIFPVGGFEKDEIKALPELENMSCQSAKESQDVCFLPDGDYASFIAENAENPGKPGKFVTTDGKVLGTHKGLYAYTVGQRKGLGVSGGRPLYVVKKDVATNTVLLGDNEELYRKTVYCKNSNFHVPQNNAFRADVKIRYSTFTAPALVTFAENDILKIEFDEPQRAPTPGQSAVFYDGDNLLGGGMIYDVQ